MLITNKKEIQRKIDSAVAGLNLRIQGLEKQSSQLRAILNSMTEGVIAVDRHANIISVNPAIEQIFGVSKSESEGRLLLEVIKNNDIFDIASGVLSSAQNASKELNLVWPVQRVFQVNAVPLFEADAVSGCLLVIHDITEIRKLEAIRRDFVANVSHELKTPLTSINGFVETLLEGALEDKENSRHFLEIVKEHTQRLNSLINDLLELSYVESGHSGLELEKVRLSEFTDKILSGFRSQLKKKTILTENIIPPELLIKADKNRLEQVLVNLIDNAIKFNRDRGFIRISSQDLNDKIKVIIEDSGPGIPEKDISRIFERFYRVDKARSRELGGTGLGLSIVKHIVELHAGMVGVDSIEGAGSKFWFTLPK